MTFTIFPAIDLRNGRVVRLQYGDKDKETVFSDDPVAMAEKWVAQGATWLHIVNLDGAFDEKGAKNQAVLPDLAKVGAKIQLGGGIRSLAHIDHILGLGIDRVILGTVAVENPKLVSEAITRFGANHIAVGIDARDGLVKTRGWLKETAVSPTQLGNAMKALGVETIIYTDISRDGVLSGVNALATAHLAQNTRLHVIASGGVATLDDIQKCYARARQGIIGVITGRALYDGRLNLAKAIEITQNK